jgi:hypothetical protein
MPGSNDSKLAEAYAMYAAVLLAVEHGFQEVIFESDNSVIIDLINNGGNPRLYLGNILSGIRRNTGRFSSVCFSSINREANKVAHWLQGRCYVLTWGSQCYPKRYIFN